MLISNIGNLEEYTFVPVPPSKCRTDAAYDDRMTEILRIAQTYEPWLDFLGTGCAKRINNSLSYRNKPALTRSDYGKLPTG